MITVSAGTDTYGRVKTVAGTPIVTKFAMLQFLPLFPLQSFYFLRAGKTKFVGIPGIASSQSATFRAIPLSRIDKTSVLMAYVRAVFATMTLLGSIVVLVFVISSFSGGKPDKIARAVGWAMSAVLGVAVIGGGLTYAFSLTSHRERAIRGHCAELLGIGVDPARVEPSTSTQLASLANGSKENQRMDLIGQLINARAKIAQGVDRLQMEVETDQLLAQLAES